MACLSPLTVMAYLSPLTVMAGLVPAIPTRTELANDAVPVSNQPTRITRSQGLGGHSAQWALNAHSHLQSLRLMLQAARIQSSR
jgi:hypothetical protein